MSTEQEQIEFLRKQLAQAEAKLAKSEDKCRRIQGRLDKAVSRNKSLTEENKELKAQVAAKNSVIVALALILRVALEELKKLPKDIPESERDIMIGLLKRVESDMTDLNRPRGQALLRYLLSRGNESLTKLTKLANDSTKAADSAEKEARSEVIQANRSIEQSEKQTKTINDVAGEAASNLQKDDGCADDAVIGTVSSIYNAETPVPNDSPVPKPTRKSLTPGTEQVNSSEQEKGKGTAGRVRPASKEIPTNVIEVSPDSMPACPGCGSEEDQVRLGTMSEFMRFLVTPLQEAVQEATFNVPVMLCKACNTVYVARPKEFPVPYSAAPGCQLSAEAVIEFGNAVASGLPLNRLETMFAVDELQVASQMFARPVDTYISKGIGRYLLEAHIKEARKAKHIGADETKFPVLDAEDRPGSPHVMVRASVPFAEKQFAIFSIMPGRRVGDIRRELEGWEFLTITRDGYAGYEGALADLGLSDHVDTQVCLVHQRRKIIATLRLEELKNALADDKAVENAMRKFREHDPQMLLLSMLKALSTVYAWEKECRRKPGESSEAHAARVLSIRRKHSLPEMDKVAELMNRLASDHAVREDNGRWRAKGTSVVSDPVVFWKNHEKELRLFLENPHISPDNNLTEATIRCCALYKTSAFFKQTMEGAASFCGWMSLRETAALNGIRYASQWMYDFHCAFMAHVERTILTERYLRLDTAKGETLRTKIHQIPQYVVNSFDFEPWLAWNYAARMKASAKKSA